MHAPQMQPSPKARSYQLNVTHGPNGRRANIQRSGPGNPLSIGVGQDVETALTLARLLFPVCPRAHQAALLEAAETAAGVALDPIQSIARRAVVLAEAIASGIWRAAITWPSLLSDSPMIAAVKAAREASDEVLASIYCESWAQVGGAALETDHARLAAAVEALHQTFRGTSALASLIIHSASHFQLVNYHSLPLGPAIWANAEPDDDRPGRGPVEETPRCLQQCQPTTDLSSWFAGQDVYIQDCLRRLTDAQAHLRQTSCRVQDKAGLAGAPVRKLHNVRGSGAGLAQTARGRLRHVVRLQDGKIAQWKAAAPTDWNFSTHGPAARAAIALSPHCGPDGFNWLIAAFDPCAPCAPQLTDPITSRTRPAAAAPASPKGAAEQNHA